MKKILLLYLFTLNCVSQTGTIQGNVFDRIFEHNAGYVGVKLTQQKKNKIKLLTYVQADSLGNFKFENLKIGEYSIIISSISSKETIHDIKVAENVITYLNIVVPSFCVYKDIQVDEYRDEILLSSCPICHKNDNVVIIRYSTPHYATYKKGEYPKDYFSKKRLYEKFDSIKNVYEICSVFEPDCKAHYYCKIDKTKF